MTAVRFDVAIRCARAASAVRGHGSSPVNVPPLDEAKLDEILVTVEELNRIVGSTGMEVTTELTEMTDHSRDVSDPDCLGALYGAEEPVYSGTGWTAVRDQVAREPNDDNDHWVEQTAVLYPAAQNAQDFFGEGDYLWEVTTQEGADGWACQHALSLVSNVTVEAWACGYSITDEAAEIADGMVTNAAK